MKRITWIFFGLISFTLFALLTFPEHAAKYIASNYYDTEDFKWNVDQKIGAFGPVLLNPLDVQEEIENLTVDASEVQQYRDFFGTQVDQIQNVQDQYQTLINDAEMNNNIVLSIELKKERDFKIEEIRKNFGDEEAVEEKILAAKKEELQKYEKKLSKVKSKSEGIRNSFAYDLVNIETNERFTFGDLKAPAIYEESYGGETRNLYVSPVNADISSFVNDELEPLNIYDIHELIKVESAQYTGTVAMLKNGFPSDFNHEATMFQRSKWIFYTIWFLGLVTGGLAFRLYKTRKNDVLEFSTPLIIKKLNLEFRLVGVLVTLVGIPLIFFSLLNYFPTNLHASNIFDGIIMFTILMVLMTITIIQTMWLYRDIKNDGYKKFWENSLTLKLFHTMKNAFLKRSLGIQIVLLCSVVFLAGIGVPIILMVPELILIYIPLFIVFVLPALYLLFKRVADYNKLAIATEQMSKGHLINDVHIRGKSVLAEHAKHLNKLREGVRVSQSEQAKSERLKTELITNVSHDLRTPLTSIITYTDLLKNPDLPLEERLSYVGILDRKSQRLKTLIEDLFEVSKMASGNMELLKQRVDLTQLMQQALAEHEEDIQTAGLDFRIAKPDRAIFALVDGQKWWRVLDNLIVNAIKYTLPGTRVYVTLKELDGCAHFTIKNVTKYELGENVDELFERFKRADTSRHTEGSGLGLAISQSIVDLHGGSMKIEVDGDLFKVKVSVQTM
ncbi:histidine kinase dimerization/phospho-acceptor domain-containing protein [Paenisporosarcina quisquiliarum]|uniref:histidine kinase dimerization/phospho-acceptor domain-containing protein n=1 Tax=Paenisporosarcina quisquiliarum TaxID=365346 RepID=UPI003734C521